MFKNLQKFSLNANHLKNGFRNQFVLKNNQLRFYSPIDSFINNSDSWTKNNEKIPLVLPDDAPSRWAEKVFRYAYNTDQLGYYNAALKDFLVRENFIRETELSMVEGSPESFDTMIELGYPEPLVQEVFPQIYQEDPALLDDFAQTFRDLYNAYYRMEDRVHLRFGKFPHTKYSEQLNKAMRYAASRVGPKDRRVEFMLRLEPFLVDGWVAEFESNKLDMSIPGALQEAIKGKDDVSEYIKSKKEAQDNRIPKL